MTLLELPTIRPKRPAALVDALLAEQQSLTAVERFARLHEAGHAREQARGHDQASFYKDLLPLSAPQAGQQYAFVVDLDACSGCKACVTACHSLNGLDPGETFRDVGGLVGRDAAGLHILQHVTTACHHCLSPACLEGCPTRAYDKDPATGIVRHLDDQCIGCQYCTLMCPYDVPKYNPAKGIVRKCDMCSQRLAEGEAPACVQACPNQAIRIEIVACETVAARAERHEFLATAPDPQITRPSTRFVTSRTLQDLQPTLGAPDRPGHLHLPLVAMLVLTQMSVGMFCAAQVLSWAGLSIRAMATLAGFIGACGLAGAMFHLGRPQIAYRAWLGWRTSWMSREIIAFQLFATAAAAYIAALWCSDAGSSAAISRLGLATCGLGAVSVFCSGMIYVATQRACWSLRRTLPRFAITTALLGIAGTVLVTQSLVPPSVLSACLMAATAARLVADTHALHTEDPASSGLAGTAELLTGPLRYWFDGQTVAAVTGGLVLPAAALLVPQLQSSALLLAALLICAAECVHRGLFFAAAVAPRMPGVPHA
jgi:formate dehydrogenase iron-sulfur subunit